MALLLALPAGAGGHVYWTNFTSNSVGRADLSGTGLVPDLVGNAASPTGVAVDSKFVYWADYGGSRISRALLDGSGAQASFITGASAPGGIAVDAQHIYWANFTTGTIGRADLDGLNVVQNFITGASSPRGVAVDGEHIYWSNVGTNEIGRANLDGTGINQAFIPASGPSEVAVDSQHIYWAGGETGKVGRANLDGTGVEGSFISVGAPANVLGVAVDAEHIYWGDLTQERIGRANLDGSGVNASFISLPSGPFGVAVDSLPRATQVAVACAPTPLFLPQPAGCTVTVTDTSPLLQPGPSAPTGDVSLSVGGGSVSGPSCALFPIGPGRSGCQFSFSAGAAGTATIDATYPGDEFHAGGRTSASFAVQPAVTAQPAVAVTTATKPSNVFALSKPRLLTKKGTATISALVVGAGKLALAGKGIRTQEKVANGPGPVELLVKPTPKASKQLRKSGTLKVGASVTFTPAGGDPSTKPVGLSLRFKP